MNKGFKILIFILLALLLIIILIIERQKINNRLNYSVITVGVITNKSKVAKGQKYLDYEFTVDGVLYEGSVNIEFCDECQVPCCDLGNKVKVRYQYGNPTNNDLMH